MIWCEGIKMNLETKQVEWTITTQSDAEFEALNNFLADYNKDKLPPQRKD